jgi:hypothetical protein
MGQVGLDVNSLAGDSRSRLVWAGHILGRSRVLCASRDQWHLVTVVVRTRTLHGGVDQKRETTPVLQNCSVLAVDGIDGRYRVRRKEPEGRVQTHPARRISGGGDAGVWMR